MFVHVSLLRPQRGDWLLTYNVPEPFQEKIEKGDIIEIPIRNTRELGIVFSVFSEEPAFDTKTIGRKIQTQFFSPLFIEYLTQLSHFFFCSPSFFLSKTAPLPFFQILPAPPEKKYFQEGIIPDISNIKGKQQQTLCKKIQHEKEVSEEEMKSLFSGAVLKTAQEKKYIQTLWKPQFTNQPIEKREKNNTETYPFSEENNTHIIIGSNHSPKNKILTEEIQKTIYTEKQVLFIFPDQISLEQAYEKFQTIFPSQWTEKYSSSLSKKGKENLFFQLLSGHTKILLGTKNALFLPFKNLGKIILHEYHNTLYISQVFPFTHAKDLAKIRAQCENIPLIFSATTGDIEEVHHLAKQSSGKILSLSSMTNTTVQIVDMNLERMNGNMSSLSLSLEKAIEKNLEKKEQSLLFLNRKGMFSSLLCRECNWIPTSPLSGNKLGVFRQNNGKKILRCTTSRYQENIPSFCPQCKKETLIEIGKGTQEIEDTLNIKFPQARVFRADKDSLSSPSKTKNFIENMEEGNIDIVIGTQIILQAFPFKRVSVVANIMTENDILFPSFKAEERGFIRNMKLFDVLGKRDIDSKIFLQTFTPLHPFINRVSRQDFSSFYQSEVLSRKSLHYPPFSESVQIIKTGKKKESLEKTCREIQKKITPFCHKIFPLHISYHPQRNIYTGKILCFTSSSTALWEKIKEKNITINKYGE